MSSTAILRDGSEALDEEGVRQLPLESVPWLTALRNRGQGHPIARRPFVRSSLGPVGLEEIRYRASGGMSSLIQLDSGEELRIEIHRESYAVLWSTEQSAGAVLRNLVPFLPEDMDRPDGMVVYTDGSEIAGDVAGLRELAQAARQVAYVRLQYADRIFTWEQRQVRFADSEDWSLEAQAGFVADRFDQRYLTGMVEATASPRLAGNATELARRVATVAREAGKFAQESLYPGLEGD